MDNIEDSWGSVHEDWSVLLNAGDHIMRDAQDIDDLRNQPDSNPSDVSAPYWAYGLWWHRNRSATGIDQDDNFAATNPTTTRDNAASDTDEDSAVPAGWSAEIGLEPTGIWAKPSWWDGCTGVGVYGEIGAYYDTINSANPKTAAQILSEGGSCAGLP
jgi:hypothetical protein